jgi:uncharacterized repeat protein (TIGR01451 family)
VKRLSSRLLGNLPKRLAAGAIVALAVALPVAVSAADAVKIEATTTVANASVTGSNWGPSATASYNQVVAVQVVYNNDEVAGSGKTANNLRVKIDLPSAPGTSQVVTTSTRADNSSTISGSAMVTLDRADAFLQYIPGTATWKHASSANGPMTVTQSVSDAVVTDPNGLVLENENPCQAGSIVIQARVVVPGISVDKFVRESGTTAWATSITAKPGDTLEYEIAYHNTGNTTEQNVAFRDQLPKGITYVPGSTKLKDGNFPNGTTISSDDLVKNGIATSSYAPGAAAYIMFTAKVASEDQLACGDNNMRNVAFVTPQGMNQFFNTADVKVTKTCNQPNTPNFSCDTLDLTDVSKDGKNIAQALVSYTANNGATFKSASFDWGDGQTTKMVTGPSANHTYSTNGPFNVVASVTFSVTGSDDQTRSSKGCEKSITFKTSETPVFSCDDLEVNKVGKEEDRTVAITAFEKTAKNGATFKNVIINWGDGSESLTTDSPVTKTHKYTTDGSYPVAAVAYFDVTGHDTPVPASSAACVKTVAYKVPPVTPPTTPPAQPTPPSQLINTGPGDVVSVVAVVTVAGAVAHNLLSRRLARQ